jgi:mono/diheme cytochrome c family protein
MRSPVARSLGLGLAAVILMAATTEAQTGAWTGCCGLAPWPQAGAMTTHREHGGGLLFHGYNYVVGGSALRHSLGVSGQIPAAYAGLRNPLPPTPQNAQRGAAVYEARCAACHGVTGLADGPGSRTLPPPAQLEWLNRLPASRRDPFMYWSIAEGGAQLKTAMPAFKGKLSDEEIWSVIGYIQARLPKPTAAP